MSVPETAPAEKPEEKPAEVPNSDAPEAQPETVENGIYTAGRLGEALEHITYIKEGIAREEAAEGANSPIIAKMKAIVGSLAEAWSEYTAEQAKELIAEGKDFDPFDAEDVEDVENSDKPATSASAIAHRASVKAISNGAAEDHEAASLAHKKAAVSSEKAGKNKMAAFHRAQQKFHKDAVANCSQANADEAVSSVSNADAVREAVSAALEPIAKRIADLEESVKASVKNADAPTAPAAPRSPAPVAVPHDMEILSVKNSDAPLNPGGRSLDEIRQHMSNPAA